MGILRKFHRVSLYRIGNDSYEIRNKNGDVFCDETDNYFIYLKNVNLKKGTLIEGTYLGDLTHDSAILDDKCKIVTSDGNNYYTEGKIVKTAKMVAVENKKNIIIIIGNN